MYAGVLMTIPTEEKICLFINNHDNTFTEAAEKYGLADNGYSTQATFFDYDKDGDLDCFVLNHSVSKYSTGVTENPEIRNKKLPEYASRLYRNDSGHFKDVSDQAGIISNVLSFGLGVALLISTMTAGQISMCRMILRNRITCI